MPELKRDVMHELGFDFESPRDALLYIHAGISYLNGTRDATDIHTILRRESWIRCIGEAMSCLDF